MAIFKLLESKPGKEFEKFNKLNLEINCPLLDIIIDSHFRQTPTLTYLFGKKFKLNVMSEHINCIIIIVYLSLFFIKVKLVQFVHCD